MSILNFKTTLRSEYFNRAPKIRIVVDHQVVYDGEVKELVNIDSDVSFTDDVENIVVCFEMYDKTNDDTRLNDDYTIASDTLIYVDSVSIEDCDITETLHKIGNYVHDFNGTNDQVTQSWTHCMGCNGRQEFVITNPVPLWLLENLP